MDSLHHTPLELLSYLDGNFDWEVPRRILSFGLEMWFMLLKVLVVRPSVGVSAFLGSVMNFRFPKTVRMARTRPSRNYVRFSNDYFNVFRILVPVCMVLSAYSRPVLLPVLQAGVLLLLCGFLKLQERIVAGHRVSVGAQKAAILSVLLSVSGLEALFLFSLLKVGCLVLLHAVLHDPDPKDDGGLSPQLENERHEVFLALPFQTFDLEVIWEIMSFGYQLWVGVVEVVVQRSLLYDPTDLGSWLRNARNRIENNFLKFSNSYLEVFRILVPVCMVLSAYYRPVLQATILLLLCGFLKLLEWNVAGHRVSVEAQQAAILRVILSVSGLDVLFLSSLLKVGGLVLLHAVLHDPANHTLFSSTLYHLLNQICTSVICAVCGNGVSRVV